MKVLVIGNPVSGGGRSGRLLKRLERSLATRGHAVEVCLTQGPGEARQRAGRLSDGIDRLVVVGGDGTLNEVLNGLPAPDAAPLCQLATGTANILAHELRLPRGPDAVAQLLETGEERRLDMGRVGDHRFLMVVSAGFDAMVTEEIRRTRGRTLGYKGYLLPIIRVLKNYRAPRLSVSVDRSPPLAGELVVVSNTANYGGLFTLADRARPDSGHLDICVLTRASLLGLIRAAAAGLTGGLSAHKGVTYLTGRDVAIDADPSVPVQIDGDHFGSTPLRIGIDPARVRFIVPR